MFVSFWYYLHGRMRITHTYIYNREPPERYQSFNQFSHAIFPPNSPARWHLRMASILDTNWILLLLGGGGLATQSLLACRQNVLKHHFSSKLFPQHGLCKMYDQLKQCVW